MPKLPIPEICPPELRIPEDFWRKDDACVIRFDYSRAIPFIEAHEIEYQQAAVTAAHEMLHRRSGPGGEYLGWVDLPLQYDRAEFERIKTAAARVRDECDALVVIGIGGSYHGARAAIESLRHSFHNLMPREHRDGPEIYFAGKDLSPTYLSELLEVLEGKELAVNVISKSGTTTEPAIAFRVFRKLLEERYGREKARRRIFVTTDPHKGALRKLATEQGYETFAIPSDVGGRYSVLTAVGLFPMAVSGVDIQRLMDGAAAAADSLKAVNLADNAAYQYAAARNALYRKGKTIELLVSYEPCLRSTADWWKQLYGESEGKDGKGIFPAYAEFSTDLHSLGQYIQDGIRFLFETVLTVEQHRRDVVVEADPDDVDGLNYLAGVPLSVINRKAFEGTLLAHSDGGVPNLLITLEGLDEFSYGQMLYFFEKACGISGYLMGVNPFNQPGVEAYKQNMYALLGKPGFEGRKEALEQRLH